MSYPLRISFGCHNPMPPNGLRFTGRRRLAPGREAPWCLVAYQTQERQHMSRSECNRGLGGCWNELQNQRISNPECCTSN
jgi:hypothetical protein